MLPLKLPTTKSVRHLTERGRGGALSQNDERILTKLFYTEYINRREMRNPTIFEAHYIRQKLNRLVIEASELADLCTDVHGEDEIILENLRELIIIAIRTGDEYEKRYFTYESNLTYETKVDE